MLWHKSDISSLVFNGCTFAGLCTIDTEAYSALMRRTSGNGQSVLASHPEAFESHMQIPASMARTAGGIFTPARNFRKTSTQTCRILILRQDSGHRSTEKPTNIPYSTAILLNPRRLGTQQIEVGHPKKAGPPFSRHLQTRLEASGLRFEFRPGAISAWALPCWLLSHLSFKLFAFPGAYLASGHSSTWSPIRTWGSRGRIPYYVKRKPPNSCLVKNGCVGTCLLNPGPCRWRLPQERAHQ